MARLIERVFDPSKPLYVRRFFAGAGRHWNPGDEFPWRRLAMDARRVRLLFEAGKLTHDGASFSAEADWTGMQSADQAAYVEPAPVSVEMQDEDIHHAAVTAPASEPDGLDDLNMVELRAIAAAEGAPTRVSRSDQREAIREHRRASAAG
jgi:hypothetical protein